MKFTNGLFEFPVRIYDGFSLRRAERQEERTEMPQEADWVQGSAEVPINEIYAIHDFFQSGRDMSNIAEEGFDGTVVMTKSLGDFICLWSRDKLKSKINKFFEEYIDEIEQFTEEELLRKEQEIEQSNRNKRRGWRFLRFRK